MINQLSPIVVKSKLNKACTIQMDFYDREYRKCIYRYGKQDVIIEKKLATDSVNTINCSAPHESIPEEEDKEGEKDASVLL